MWRCWLIRPSQKCELAKWLRCYRSLLRFATNNVDDERQREALVGKTKSRRLSLSIALMATLQGVASMPMIAEAKSYEIRNGDSCTKRGEIAGTIQKQFVCVRIRVFSTSGGAVSSRLVWERRPTQPSATTTTSTVPKPKPIVDPIGETDIWFYEYSGRKIPLRQGVTYRFLACATGPSPVTMEVLSPRAGWAFAGLNGGVLDRETCSQRGIPSRCPACVYLHTYAVAMVYSPGELIMARWLGWDNPMRRIQIFPTLDEEYSRISESQSNGTFFSNVGCAVRGLDAIVEVRTSTGSWAELVGASGWLVSSNCPSTRPIVPWANVFAARGSVLRWRIWSDSDVWYSQPFTW